MRADNRGNRAGGKGPEMRGVEYQRGAKEATEGETVPQERLRGPGLPTEERCDVNLSAGTSGPAPEQ